jgi:hypothetical protein
MRSTIFFAFALVATPLQAAPVDALTVTIDQTDADRFAKLFRETGGRPTADQIQKRYLDGAGDGVRIFTPNRIENAANLAAAVAAQPDNYRYAIETCLPLVASMNAQLRATYLGYGGLIPGRPLPRVHVVFGAGTSGGFASPDAQVLGLEVSCGKGTAPDQFRAALRGLFAHETVHSWQSRPAPAAMKDWLLFMAIFEGTPDYLASLVTGAQPNPAREAWARAQEAKVWADFQKDRATLLARTSDDFSKQPAQAAAASRWFYNYGRAPEGWPFEAGYWVGMQIAAAYVAQAADKRAAINDLIEAKDPAAILKASGYEARFAKR